MLSRLGREHRDARIAAGLSLRACAAASGASYPQLLRFERGEVERLNLPDVGAWCSVVGLELAVRGYPAGDPLRDRGQLALLERFRARLHPGLRWRTEVPLPIPGDLRAWDADVRAFEPVVWRARIEAETRITDGQALERRLALKIRDDPDGHVILLVADTRTNRRAIAAIRAGLVAMFPATSREVLAALGAGRQPPGNCIIVM